MIGLAVFAGPVAFVALFTGALRLVPSGGLSAGDVLLSLCTLLALAAKEELGFRGHTLRALVPILGSWRAQAIVALAFALSHVAFGWPWQTIVLGVFPSALLFGACAMDLGLHSSSSPVASVA